MDASVLEKHDDLFKSEDIEEYREDYKPSAYVIDAQEKLNTYDVESIEDIPHETERDESLSIEAKEKELIIKALRKNNNKRKYAAQDLGISERTLYRKIKQYEIEN